MCGGGVLVWGGDCSVRAFNAAMLPVLSLTQWYVMCCRRAVLLLQACRRWQLLPECVPHNSQSAAVCRLQHAVTLASGPQWQLVPQQHHSTVHHVPVLQLPAERAT